MSSKLLKPAFTAPKVVSNEALKDTERVFVAEYVANGLRLAPAVKKAYPAVKHSSQYGQALLKRPRIQRYLAKILKGRMVDAELKSERVLAHLRTALFLDPIEVFEKVPGRKGLYRIKTLEDIPPDVRACIKTLRCKLSYDPEGNEVTYVEVELMDKDAALQLAMKYLGLTKPDATNIYNINKPTINFDQLCTGRPGTTDVDDEVEARILAEQNEAIEGQILSRQEAPNNKE